MRLTDAAGRPVAEGALTEGDLFYDEDGTEYECMEPATALALTEAGG